MKTSFVTMLTRTLFVPSALLSIASAQTACSSFLKTSDSATIAPGYQVGLVATGLARPRGIQFDRDGHLLVVEAPKDGSPAVSALTLNDSGGICVSEASRKTVVQGQGVTKALQKGPLLDSC